MLIAEREALGANDTMSGGALLAISKDGVYKGVVTERNPDNGILRYSRGLRLAKDPFANEYTLIVGTANNSLLMEAQQFSNNIVPDQSTELTSPVQVPNTDAVNGDFFAFGFTTKNKTTGYQYISDITSNQPIIYAYSNGGTATTCLDYSAEVTNYSGWSITAMYTGIGSFAIRDLLVARSEGNNLAIDELSFTCSTQNFDIINDTIGDVHATDVTRFESTSGAWDQDIFVTINQFFTGPIVLRYDASNSYAKDNSPFTDNARAMYWVSDSTSDRKIWTLEEDSSNFYIRRYDHDGNLEATVYTDSGKQVLYAYTSASLVVIPEN